VRRLLNGDGAHQDFESVIKELPAALRGKTPKNALHSPWQLLEHLRIAQWDVLESIRSPKHVSPEFPTGYWPEGSGPANEKDWNQSADGFRADFKALMAMVNDPEVNLVTELAHAEGQTILRKLLMLADHNSYHLGQMVVVRRLLGAWE
jgi:uncharacterized damage-inducible protein DinB